jgi:hypothetical protein
MKTCPVCRAQLLDTATCCRYCGHGGGVAAVPVTARATGVFTGTVTKACPFCAEQILPGAVKCKHCGSMLDGSSQKVTVASADPFAEYHGDIRGKKAGNITVVGYLGIGVGILAIAAAGMALTMARDGGFGAFMMFLFGMGFIVASYLWARR